MPWSKNPDGSLITAERHPVLGRDSFKRVDNGSEAMNIDGRATGTPEVLWNGTGAADTGGDWNHQQDGTETTQSAKNGTNGLDSGSRLNGDKSRFNNGSMTSLSGYSEVTFWMQPKAYPTGSKLKVGWLNSTNDLVGVRLNVEDYVENMDLDVWQHVHVPIEDFGLTGDIQKFELKYQAADGQQFWFDDIELIPTGGGPYRFEFVAPDANTVYHVSMLVLSVMGPVAGWNHDAFGNIANGLDRGLILRQKDTATSELLWKFVCYNNQGLYGHYHPQEDVTFADSEMLVGFMIKPGLAAIKVTDTTPVQFVVRDDLSALTSMRAYVHYGVEDLT